MFAWQPGVIGLEDAEIGQQMVEAAQERKDVGEEETADIMREEYEETADYMLCHWQAC